MNQETKSLLKRSINHFLSVTDQEKENCINNVKHEIKMWENGCSTKKQGYSTNQVQIGKIFLRIFNK